MELGRYCKKLVFELSKIDHLVDRATICWTLFFLTHRKQVTSHVPFSTDTHASS